MSSYVFGPYNAYDPETNQLVKNGEGQIFAVADTARVSPLTVTGLAGVPLDFVRSSLIGVINEFIVEDYPEVIWKSGIFEIKLQSFTGLMEKAQAAAESAAEITPQQIDNRLGGDSSGLVQRVQSVETTKADLGPDNKVLVEQLPSAVVKPVYRGTVANQTAMLAVAAAVTGDWVLRSDTTSTGAQWVMIGANPAVLASWKQIPGGTSSGGGVPAGTKQIIYFSGLSTAARPGDSSVVVFSTTTDGLQPANKLPGDRWLNAPVA